MSRYELINGYTKASLKALVRKNNLGKPATFEHVALENDTYFMKGELIVEHCVYFNPADGNRCVVGCCLPDDFIERNRDVLTEELDANGLVNRYPELKKHMPLDEYGLIGFQNAHDHYEDELGVIPDFHDYMDNWIDENCKEEEPEALRMAKEASDLGGGLV